MSKLGYKIQQALDEVGTYGTKPTLWQYIKATKYFFMDLYYDYPYVWKCNVKYMWKNLKFFMPHIIHMRDWDQSYQIELFCDGLEYLAKGLKSNVHHINSGKYSKRCLFASARLRKAYSANACDDKSYLALSKANPIKFVSLGNGCSQMIHDYGPRGKEYYSKMFKLIHERQEKVIGLEKKEAWLYIHKYIEHWWS